MGQHVGVRQEEVRPQRHPPHPLPREKGQGKEVRCLLQASKLKSIQTGGGVGLTPDYQLERLTFVEKGGSPTAVCAREPRGGA